MSPSAIVAVALLNLLYLASGLAIIWLVRGWDTWLALVRLAGLAYLVGVVTIGAAWTFWLIAGGPFSLSVVIAVPVLVSVASVTTARMRGRERPQRTAIDRSGAMLVAAAGVAATGLLLEALFRSARLSGIYWWDAWSFWIPKAIAIYKFGDLDEGFFTGLPGASYPPLIPVLDAAVFHVIGSPDVVTLHTQYWLFGVGFVWALAGLLVERVRPWVLWPFLVLALVAPRIGRRFLVTEADLFVDFLFVLAAVLILYWLLDRDRWRLVLATVLMCGMVLTKREGLLLFVLLLVASFVTSSRRWRSTWPALGVATGVVVLAAAPWRLWYVAHGVGGEGPRDGFVQGDRFDVLWPAVRRALDVFWDPGYWNLIVPIALAALVLAALARAGAMVVFFATLLGLVVLGGIWATWVFSQTGEGLVIGGNFVIRFMGSAALLCTAAAPLLVDAAWGRVQSSESRHAVRQYRVGLAAAIVAGPLLAYPVVAVAGGAPRFPTRTECSRPAVDGKPVEIVYGHFDSPVDAAARRDSVVAVGFLGTEVVMDNCGRWKVVYRDAPSIEIASKVQEEARTVGIASTLELGSGE